MSNEISKVPDEGQCKEEYCRHCYHNISPLGG